MTAREIFDEMINIGISTRENIDKFFFLLSSDIFENQLAMELTSDDGIEYISITNNKIKVTE